MNDRRSSIGHDENHWHLDKRVPVALILAIIIQTIGAVWWAASLSARVDALERQSDGVTRNAAGLQGLELQITRLAVQQAGIKTTLDRIGAKLERLLEKK